MDSRRYLSTFAVFALVLLRLVIGWHFFREGGEKVEYDRHDGEWRMVFSADGFLTRRKGPLARFFRSQAPDDHGCRELLAVPRENVPPTPSRVAERAQWQADYKRRRAEAEKAGGEVPVEFPPSAPYHDWAERIADDWRTIRRRGEDGARPDRRAESSRPTRRCAQRLQQAGRLSGSEDERHRRVPTRAVAAGELADSPEAATCRSTTSGSPRRPPKPTSQPTAWVEPGPRVSRPTTATT